MINIIPKEEIERLSKISRRVIPLPNMIDLKANKRSQELFNDTMGRNKREDLVNFCDFLEENGRPVDYSLIDEYLNKE